ncbi:hypothetical protein C3495_06370 [Clostridiaceae bacterium 14S0207]|nr:hypothetical protein C3495_06370 [Clostridiaceae bacterium 14S0207]
MPKVYIADKETLDNVKQDTNNIKESISNVTNNVQYIKNQFPLKINGGTDWSRYETLEQEQKINKHIKELKDKNILSINGKGYIRDLIVYGKCEVTIYVDDKEIYKKSTYDYVRNSFCYLGFEHIGDRSYDLRYIARHSYNAGDYINTKLIIQPIFFEKSLRVKVWGEDNYAYNIDTLYFLGGVEK